MFENTQMVSSGDLFRALATNPDVFNTWYDACFRQGLSVANALRFATPLPPEAEKLIDDAVVRVGRERLRVGTALIDAGLTKPLPQWMAVPNLQQRRRNEYGMVQETMVLRVPTEAQLGDEDTATVPIFARVGGTEFGIRELMTAARSGLPLDTEGVEQITRRMNEMFEEQTLNGSTLNVGGNTATGFANAPNVNTFNFETNLAWDNASKTGPNIKADIITGVQALRDANFFGPYGLIYPSEYDTAMQKDYFTGASGSLVSIESVISAMFGGITMIPADRCPTNTVYLFQMSTDVVDVIIGDYPTATQWSETPGLLTKLIIISCLITRTKDNYDGASGIAIGTPS